MTIAVLQMTSVDDWETNVAAAMRLVRKAFELAVPKILFFPENSLYMRLKKGSKIPAVELSTSHMNELSEFAVSHGCHIFLGSIPLFLDGRVYNSTVWLHPDGSRSAPYQKIHLFDIQLKDDEAIRESDEFAHGPGPIVVDVEGWKIGLSICYDLRFSELYATYAGVDIIAVPSAFLVKTGQAHWHTLLRARAIEAQSFVVAAAQSGSHAGLRETYGHSLIVDPWGEVVSEASGDRDVLVATLDRSRLKSVREQIPMSQHRRLRR